MGSGGDGGATLLDTRVAECVLPVVAALVSHGLNLLTSIVEEAEAEGDTVARGRRTVNALQGEGV